MACTFFTKGQTNVTWDLDMKIYFIVFVFCFLFLLSSSASAHGLYISSKDGQLHAYFNSGSPASNAIVKIVDDSGLVILNDNMDENGNWSLPDKFDYPPHLIVVETPGGHRTQIIWQKAIENTRHGVFDSLIVQLILGISVLVGSGFGIKCLISPKSKF